MHFFVAATFFGTPCSVNIIINNYVFEVNYKFTFYVGQHGHSQRSFIKDKISGERYQDH